MGDTNVQRIAEWRGKGDRTWKNENRPRLYYPTLQKSSSIYSITNKKEWKKEADPLQEKMKKGLL